MNACRRMEVKFHVFLNCSVDAVSHQRHFAAALSRGIAHSIGTVSAPGVVCTLRLGKKFVVPLLGY